MVDRAIAEAGRGEQRSRLLPARRPALERQLRLLAGEVERARAAGDDARAGIVADMQGIGSGPDVLTPLRAGDGSHPA